MKHTWKKAAAGLLALTMLTGGVPAVTPAQDMLQEAVLTAHAAEVVASGYCGTEGHEQDVAWTLDDGGTLTISGTGEMADNRNVVNWNAEAIRPKIKKVVIKDGVTSVGVWAFSECSNLESVVLPTSITSIGEYAFNKCKSLQFAGIPEGVTSIGDGAFCNCISLESVSIPSSVTSIGIAAFIGCQSMKTVIISTSALKLPGDMFAFCYNLTSVVLDADAVVEIEESMFQDTPADLVVYVPDGLVDDYKTDDSWASFQDNNYGIIQSGDGCVWDCGAEGSACTAFLSTDGTLTISGTGAMADLESGEDSSWYGSRANIKRIVIQNGVTHIGNYAFYDCTAAKSVTIPESVTSIGRFAFFFCEALESVTIPGSVESIGQSAFLGCSSLTSVTIPEGVTSIGEYTFQRCQALESVTIPESVTNIGDCAFFNCRNLKTVRVEAIEPPTLGESVFCSENGFGVDSPLSDVTFFVPFEDIERYKQADGWKEHTFAGMIRDTGTSRGYRQQAENNGTYYTRFVFVVPMEDFKGKSGVRYTVTYDKKPDTPYTFDSTCYYTGMTTNGTYYVPANDDSALFVVTVGSSEDLYRYLTCKLSFT